MDIPNYYKLDDKSLFYAFYIYADTKDYSADHILYTNGIRKIKFMQELHCTENDYAVILCRIRRKYEKAFIKSMEELKNKLLILGYTDYEQFCIDFKHEIMDKSKEVING